MKRDETGKTIGWSPVSQICEDPRNMQQILPFGDPEKNMANMEESIWRLSLLKKPLNKIREYFPPKFSNKYFPTLKVLAIFRDSLFNDNVQKNTRNFVNLKIKWFLKRFWCIFENRLLQIWAAI
jgi:hypothetical protein